MSPIDVNLDGVEAWEGGVILPPGQYFVRVTDAEEGQSANGSPQIQLQLRAVGGEHDGGEIRDWLVVQQNTLGKVKQVLGALGMASEGQLQLSAAAFVGKTCEIVVRSEVYDGKDRSKVKAYSPAQQSDVTPVGASASANGTSSDLPF